MAAVKARNRPQEVNRSPRSAWAASQARPGIGSYVPLLWRVFALSAAVLAVAVGLTVLVLPPALKVSVAGGEFAILVTSLGVILVINLLFLRQAFAPLERLAEVMRDIDPLRPGQRVPIEGSASEVTQLATSFNAMLGRLEDERQESASRVLAAQEAERLRVAQELHDEVGQSLTAVLLDLTRVERRAPAELVGDLNEIQASVLASLEDSRRIALELRPEALDDLGLAVALRVLTDRLGERAGINIADRIEHDLPSLDHDQELVVYRVAQEALTNVIRHAGAGRAELQLRRHGDRLELRIRDDGRGVDGDEAIGGGIRGMHERALMVRGVLEMRQPPEGGLEVTLDVPLERQS
jgi:two-component system, NarL family, sensor histidine kinase UhpB